MATFNQDSLTLDETNKVRISLGLAPIGGDADAGADGAEAGADAPHDSLADQADVAEANYAARKDEERRAREEAEVKERIEKSRKRAALNAKLKGSTLGDTGADDSLSAKSWLKQQKKRARRHAEDALEKKRREQEEQDAMVYDERLKVSHGADDFETGEDVVLTLKDSRVLGEDEDELQNVNLADYDADRAVKERKRKAAEQYTGYDDDEFEEGRIGRKADVLGKYDDEFATGKVRSEGFRLGAPNAKRDVVVDDDVEMVGAPASKVKLDLNFAKDFEVSDYMKEGDRGFKVKKKKVKRSTRKAEGDDDAAGDMDVDSKPTFERRVVGDGPANLVDDDDLQAALSRARRENARKRTRAKPEDLAAQIAQRRTEEEAEAAAPADGDDDGRITFDDTSEFVRNVTAESRAVASARPERAASSAPAAPVVVKIERDAVAGGEAEDGEVDGDADMDSEDEDEALAEMAAREGLSLAEYRLKIDAQLREMDTVQAESSAAGAGGDDDEEEAVAGSGVAGVLALLRNQGALRARSAADDERERVQKQRDLWLADHRRRMAQRELDRIQARGGNKDQAQREWENRMREQQDAREALDAYKDYKPDIHLVYHDEFGREMTPKEAWKSLSHKFHGKTSGRMKAAKRIKKIEEEQKARSMASSDTPLGMSNAFQRRQEKTGEAFMVLSVGNKGSVQETAKGKGRR